jgi:LuxR family maltose regulon positive regulatory protein
MAGDLEAAARELQKAMERMSINAPAWVRPEVVSQQVRIYLAQGRLDAAETALRGENFDPDDTLIKMTSRADLKMTFGDGELYNSVLRVLLYRGRTRHDEKILQGAIAFADRLIEESLRIKYLPLGLEGLLIRAQINTVLHDAQASLLDVARALELAKPEGNISIFLEEGKAIRELLTQLLKKDQFQNIDKEYIRRILDAQTKIDKRDKLPGDRFVVDQIIGSDLAMPVDSIQITDPLSQRELEVLRLINDGCSNQEIAEKLTLSLHTVKKHISNIFIKLGASSRTQAIAQGRKLNFL